MGRVILFLALAALAVAALYWFAYADTRALARLVRRSGGLILLVLAALLALTGRWVVALPIAVLAIAVLRGGTLAGFGLGPRGRQSAGARSTVRSRFLDMHLDHDTGEMDGSILDGPFQGRQLSELTQGELLALRAFIAGDDESTALLETYLDKRFAGWRETSTGADAGAGAQSAAGEPMSVEEAREILGVAPNATASEIRAAHRAKMKRAHPDQGGSTYFASKLNQAREILLKSVGAKR